MKGVKKKPNTRQQIWLTQENRKNIPDVIIYYYHYYTTHKSIFQWCTTKRYDMCNVYNGQAIYHPFLSIYTIHSKIISFTIHKRRSSWLRFSIWFISRVWFQIFRIAQKLIHLSDCFIKSFWNMYKHLILSISVFTSILINCPSAESFLYVLILWWKNTLFNVI